MIHAEVSSLFSHFELSFDVNADGSSIPFPSTRSLSPKNYFNSPNTCSSLFQLTTTSSSLLLKSRSSTRRKSSRYDCLSRENQVEGRGSTVRRR